MDDKDRAIAESTFTKKERQKSEGEKAWAEYKARETAVNQNTVKLRAERLAREATAKKNAPASKKKKKKA